MRSDAGATSDRLPDFNLDYMQYEAQADRPKQYAAGRRCCHDGCKTILSRYNGGTMCGQHRAADDCCTDSLIFGEQLCPTCEVPKPRNSEHFGKDVSSVDGLYWECSECRNARQRAARKSHADYERIRYQTNPEFRERRKATSRENKARRYATDPEYRERVKAQARASKARCKVKEIA